MGESPIKPVSSTPSMLPSQVGSDLEYVTRLTSEFWVARFPKLRYEALDKQASTKHRLYHEAKNKVWLPAVEVPVHVDFEPSTKRLSSYGIDELRPVIFGFHVGLLRLVNRFPENSTAMIGGLVEFDGDKYEIMTQHRAKESYWAQTNAPLFIVCSANVFRRGT